MAHKSRHILAIVGTGALLAGGLGMGMVGTMGPGIQREGDSAHIQAVREIETQPFDMNLFAGLDGWTHGNPLDSEAIKDKVVLIGVVAIDDAQSMMTLSSLARYQRQNADKGLVVLAVHPETGWDTIGQKVADGRVKVQVARDVDGAFAKGLLADNYPDLYLIDRAGQLRFGDIESKSLKAAVSRLLRETTDEAIANAQDQANGIEVAFEEEVQEPKGIPTAKYANANWPMINSGKLNAKNYQGKALPVALGTEKWISKKKDLEGKVIVLDFWATWCGPCKRASPTLDKLQKEFEGKLEVLAIGGQSEDISKVRNYARSHRVAYSHLFDKKQSIYRQLEIRAIPHTIVMSTDGVIRWQGNPLSPAFKAAVEQVIREDPMFADG